ncbi:helicase-related protein [Candidatus Sulfurimonas baltica]|uniref:DEAD/DEAH box helicase n=1 Tax=Candidatus Sulfurimonas baltica TaxID=2740404 RepID=A0A7S7RMA8_9BACT|nr:DEAD/DEAH box helicase [Candidatus Sulfurimonas baltica]QOY51238.1 DEAD/DEAH box helicase [Candidatus Sulfurimonas baltica]
MSEEKTKKPSKKKYYDNVSVGKRTKQVAYLVKEGDKASMLEFFIKNSDKKQSVVVVRSKRRADELNEYLKTKDISATSIHGNHRVEQHEEAAKAFNSGELNILITTDMILQSLELNNIQTILNYDLPPQHEDYFNRLILVDGVGESICFVSPEEEGLLSILELRLKNEMPQEELEGFTPEVSDEVAHVAKDKKKKPRHRKQIVKKVKKKKAE